jgi:hypothetical protein
MINTMFVHKDRLFNTGLGIPPGYQRGGGPNLITIVIESIYPSIRQPVTFPRSVLNMVSVRV